VQCLQEKKALRPKIEKTQITQGSTSRNTIYQEYISRNYSQQYTEKNGFEPPGIIASDLSEGTKVRTERAKRADEKEEENTRNERVKGAFVFN